MDLQQYNGWALVPRLVPAILIAGVLAFLPTLPIPQLESNAIYDDPNNAPHHGEWSSYGAGRSAQRYPNLTQIDPDNVKNLKMAWTYHTSDIPAKYGSELAPLKIGDRVHQTRLGIGFDGLQGALRLAGLRTVRKPFRFPPARHPRCPRQIQLPRFRRPAGRLLAFAILAFGIFSFCIPVRRLAIVGRIAQRGMVQHGAESGGTREGRFNYPFWGFSANAVG